MEKSTLKQPSCGKDLKVLVVIFVCIRGTLPRALADNGVRLFVRPPLAKKNFSREAMKKLHT